MIVNRKHQDFIKAIVNNKRLHQQSAEEILNIYFPKTEVVLKNLVEQDYHIVFTDNDEYTNDFETIRALRDTMIYSSDMTMLKLLRDSGLTCTADNRAFNMYYNYKIDIDVMQTNKELYNDFKTFLSSF